MQHPAVHAGSTVALLSSRFDPGQRAPADKTSSWAQPSHATLDWYKLLFLSGLWVFEEYDNSSNPLSLCDGTSV